MLFFKKKKLVFEKSITRDWGIIYAQIWHEVFTSEFKKQIGWGYTEVVFEGQKNTISIYRAPKEHIEGMRNFILNQLDKDNTWLKQQAVLVEEKAESVLTWVNKAKLVEWSEYSNEELASTLKEFVAKNIELGPAFIMMLWFPIQMEQHPESEKYKSAVDTAIECRAKIEKIGPLVDTFAREISVEALRRANLSSDYSKFITYQELLAFFTGGINFNEQELNSRKIYFLFTKLGILYDPLKKYLLDNGFDLKETEIEKTDIIKGRTAFSGYGRGIVKVINSKEEFGKMNEGDILVTGMTTPDFLPAIQKSSAFVTDEGGITCHAAIVSRELKKPCIIGTKIATQVLHDGDLVEVDADKGEVRILEKR
jgi:phosphoenolpyruvate synthase/pyruvate phosphate dikinase